MASATIMHAQAMPLQANTLFKKCQDSTFKSVLSFADQVLAFAQVHLFSDVHM